MRADRRRVRWLRLIVWVLVGCLALLVAVGLLTLRLFVAPPASKPRRADAVVMLSGDHGERLEEALRLLESGVAPVLVHAGDPDTSDVRILCRDGAQFEVVCLTLNPDSTRDEARAVGKLVRERGWKKIVLVTSTQHVTRAGLLFRRCTSADVDTVPAWPDFEWRIRAQLIRHEWLALAHAVVLARGC